MKKVRMVISLFLLMLFAFGQVKAMSLPAVKNIPMHKEKGHLGTRTEGPNVSVSLDEAHLVVSISRYVGEVNVILVDVNGSIVVNDTFVVNEKNDYLLRSFTRFIGFYSITVELDNVTYYGIIDD